MLWCVCCCGLLLCVSRHAPAITCTARSHKSCTLHALDHAKMMHAKPHGSHSHHVHRHRPPHSRLLALRAWLPPAVAAVAIKLPLFCRQPGLILAAAAAASTSPQVEATTAVSTRSTSNKRFMPKPSGRCRRHCCCCHHQWLRSTLPQP